MKTISLVGICILAIIYGVYLYVNIIEKIDTYDSPSVEMDSLKQWIEGSKKLQVEMDSLYVYQIRELNTMRMYLNGFRNTEYNIISNELNSQMLTKHAILAMMDDIIKSKYNPRSSSGEDVSGYFYREAYVDLKAALGYPIRKRILKGGMIQRY